MATAKTAKRSYLSPSLTPDRINKNLNAISDLIEKEGVDNFDTIVCIGVSGMLLAPMLAAKYHKELIVVRKGLEGTHSKCILESSGKPCHKYIIIDDLMASCNTVRNLLKSVSEHKNRRAKCVGIFLYYHVLDEETLYEFEGIPVRSTLIT